MKTAIYAGSFDPITIGHMDILRRACNIFDKVIVLVSVNKDKKYRSTKEERVKMILDSIGEFKNVEVDSYDGLVVKYAKEHGSKFLIRGLRVVSDFDYEWKIASANEYIDSSIEIVFFMAHSQTSFISSSAINEMFDNNVDIKELVPPAVLKAYKNK